MRNIIVAVVVLAACSKKDECEKLFDKMSSAMPELAKENADKRDKGLAQCREHLDDMKKDPMVKCVLDASGNDEVKKCMGDAFGDYKKKSKASEASLFLNRIAKSNKRIFAETGSFSATNGALLPAGAQQVGKNCCGGTGGVVGSPGATVNNKCTANPKAFAADPGWTALEFSVDEASQYQYSYVGGAKEFTAYAIGDLDCDGTSATWTMKGTIDASGNPKTELVPPPSGVY